MTKGLYKILLSNKSFLWLIALIFTIGTNPLEGLCNPNSTPKERVKSQPQELDNDKEIDHEALEREIRDSYVYHLLSTPRTPEEDPRTEEEKEEEREYERYNQFMQGKSRYYLIQLTNNPSDTLSAYDLVLLSMYMCSENDLASKSWRNYEPCKLIAEYVPMLLDHEDERFYVAGINVCLSAAYAISNHPRLKLKLLNYYNDACLKHGLEPDKDVAPEIEYLTTNIQNWDNGHPEDIICKDKSYEKSDPIEWSPQYEEVIHLVLEKANEALKFEPRQLGFCHTYWDTLRYILKHDYDIEWRDPSMMNPDIMFD